MEQVKKSGLLGLLLLAAVFCLSQNVQARVWLGPQIGTNWVTNTDLKEGGAGFPDETVHLFRFQDANLMLGFTLGYDFVKEGFLGYNYPEWMKYFSFVVDFTYSKAPFDDQLPLATNGISRRRPFLSGELSYLLSLSFLVMAKYGFLPDQQVPFGRLQPYLALGPGLIFSSLDMTNNPPGGFSPNPPLGTASAANVAIVAEAGVRYFVLPYLSVDGAFRYRYAYLNYDFAISGGRNYSIGFNANIINIILRVCYHF